MRILADEEMEGLVVHRLRNYGHDWLMSRDATTSEAPQTLASARSRLTKTGSC